MQKYKNVTQAAINKNIFEIFCFPLSHLCRISMKTYDFAKYHKIYLIFILKSKAP